MGLTSRFGHYVYKDEIPIDFKQASKPDWPQVNLCGGALSGKGFPFCGRKPLDYYTDY